MTGFRIVCRYDPALDPLAMGPEGVFNYRETGDISLAKFREGMTPTVFHCRRLTVSEMQSVKSAADTDSAYVAAFCRGIMRVEALRPLDPSEEDEKADRRTTWTRPDAERPVTARELDVSFSAGDVFEVGALIYGRSILGKGRPAAWPLPATSRLAVAALVHQLAGQTSSPAASSPLSRSSPEAPPAATGGG